MMHQTIGIHSVPRSGSTWIGEIFNSIPSVKYRFQPFFTYEFKYFLGVGSSQKDIDEFFTKLFSYGQPYLEQTELRMAGILPVFEKIKPELLVYKAVRNHFLLPVILRKCSYYKVLLLIRNPMSVVNSWLRASKEFRKDQGWNELDEWRFALKKNINRPDEYHGFEKWKEATRLFLFLQKNYPDKVYLLNYDRDLLVNTKDNIIKVFSFFKIPFTEQTKIFLNTSKSSTKPHENSVYKENITDSAWKDQLNPIIIDAIRTDLKGTELESFLYIE